MITARAQKNTTDGSKGNTSRSNMFIAPKKAKKTNEKAADDKSELFIAPTRQESEKETIATEQTAAVENTSKIIPISKGIPEEKEEVQDVEAPQNEVQESPTVAKDTALNTTTANEKAATPKANQTSEAKTTQKSNTKGIGGGGGGGKAYNVPEAPKNDAAEKEAVKEEDAPLTLPTENSKAYADGLASQTPINFIRGVKQSSTTLTEVQGNEQKTLTESLPEIEQPTGIPIKSAVQKEKAKAASDKVGEQIKGDKSILGDLSPTGKKEGAQIETKSVQPPSSVLARIRSFFGLGRSGKDEDRKSEIKSGIKKLPTSESVDTSPGEKPTVDLTGQADPNKNKENLDESTATANKETEKNLAESKLYKGEDDIYPEMELELMSPTVELSEPPKTSELSDEMPVLSAEVKSNFDASAQEQLDKELAPHMEQQDAEYTKMQADQEKEREKSETDIDKETERVKKEQEKAQSTAKSDVASQRGEWQKENENVKKEYSEKSEAEKKKIDGQIDTKVKDADTKITKEYDTAKKEADKEVAKTDKEAEDKKAQAKKDSEKKSWWDRAIDAVSDFFDKLKEGLNKLFDGLRKLVKGLIEAAKKFANKLIDLARDAIVGMIKAFGEVLKGFVNIALAAFPKLRDKFNAAIDKAVNVAVEAVNAFAEGLKKAVNALLDLLGAALDAILAAYQAAFNLLLDAMKFLTVGLIKIMRGLANLVLAAIEMPSNFWGQLSEEFLGMDVTKPLPFERNTPYTASVSEVVSESGASSPVTDYTNKSEYTPEDFVVDEVPNDMQLSDELMSQVLTMPENGEMEFGASNEETMEHLSMSSQADVSAATGGMEGITEATGGGAEGGDMVMPPELYGNTTGQIDWFINKQSAQAPQNIPDSAEGKQAASQEAIPPAMRVLEPLGVGDRLYYLKTQMMTAIKKKWEENKALYITIGTLVVLAITALAIATGGAIFSLIPPALQIFAALMAGAAVLKASGFFGSYISEGWVGNIVKGGAALARAIGILLVELIFILLFDMSALLKVLKSGVKGSLKMAVTGTKNTFKALGTGFKESGKGLLKTGTKIVTGVKGIGKGVGKGAKTLDDFAKRMMKKAKFKGFKFKRKGKWFQVYGSVNPWVLLASGKLEEIKGKQGKVIGQDGKFIAKNGDEIEGILVATSKTDPTKATKYLDELTLNTVGDNVEIFKKLLKEADITKRVELMKGVIKIDYEKLAKEIGQEAADAVKNRGNLRKALEKALKESGEVMETSLFEAHHLLPVELLKSSDILQKAMKGGFKFNDLINARWAKKFSSKIDDLKDGIHASHPKYTQQVGEFMERELKVFLKKSKVKNLEGLTPEQAKAFIDSFVAKVGSKVDDLIETNKSLPLDQKKKLNDLVF